MKRSVLLFAVSAVMCSSSVMAAEPAPAGDQAMVAGIDARTGKLRQLSDAEVAELSSQAQRQSAAQARSSTHPALAAIPQTAAEAEKTLRILPNGLSVASLPLSAMHSMTAELGADGKLVISESEHGHAGGAQEVSE